LLNSFSNSSLAAIEAVLPNLRLLVYVVSAIYPDVPATPLLNQIHYLNKHARKIRAEEVWVAKVQLTQDLELYGSISWARISQ
jgi:hypothetical protein